MKIKYFTPVTESLILFENANDFMLSGSDGGDLVGTTDPPLPF